MQPGAPPDWRCVALRGLPPAAASRAFSLASAARALHSLHPTTVYAELDSSRRLTARAAGPAGAAGAWEPALLLRARLSPHALAGGARLQRAAGGALRVALCAGAAPHDELLLWPEPELLAAAGLPALTPRHIRGSADYRCDVCGESYEHPNPLKVHLYLQCARPTAPAFWRRVLSRLQAAAAPPPPAARTAPAALEALAATWGARGPLGHECVYCGKLYSRKYGLKIHIRTHTGYKPLRCAHCARRFGDPSNLNKHVRLHAAAAGAAGAAGAASAARYGCGACGAVLARRRDLLRHARCRHPPGAAATADTHLHTTGGTTWDAPKKHDTRIVE